MTECSYKMIIASPAARRLATKAALELKNINGTGPNGRIVAKDVKKAKDEKSIKKGNDFSAVSNCSGIVPKEEITMTGMRRSIAKRLQQSKQIIPHFYCSVNILVDTLIKYRAALNQHNPAIKLSINDFIVGAVAQTLIEVDAVNVQYNTDTLIRFKRADISVAVAIKGGLITPVIRGANLKGVNAISIEVKELAKSAKSGTLLPESYQGGTFTVSNVGMYDLIKAEGIINYPQAAILVVGKGVRRPVVIDDKIEIGTEMIVSLSCDHRVIDGVTAAKFLSVVKRHIENPIEIAL